MYWKKEIIISFCIITISASNLYMPMIRLYVFLLDFLFRSYVTQICSALAANHLAYSYFFKLVLKGHDNEADFLGFLHKLVPCESLPLPFEPSRFWLCIHGYICNKKTNRRIWESAIDCLKENSPRRWVGESSTPQLGESVRGRLLNSPSREVAMGSRGAIPKFLNFIINFQNFKRLNQA